VGCKHEWNRIIECMEIGSDFKRLLTAASRLAAVAVEHSSSAPTHAVIRRGRGGKNNGV
jgi:hypothetical protein